MGAERRLADLSAAWRPGRQGAPGHVNEQVREFIRSAQRVAETPGTYSPHDSDLESLLLTLCKELTPSEQKQLMSLLLREGITGLLLRLGIRDR